MFVFFFKQKTAYEMRISDWSSDVCSSDLQDLVGKSAVISGSGNVATHAAEKIVQLGGKVLTLSDSAGFIHDPDGITQEKIDWVKAHKKHRSGRIEDYCAEYKGATLTAGKSERESRRERVDKYV